MQNDPPPTNPHIPFSTRTSWDTRESDLGRALRERREQGSPLYDLTASNPTLCGFDYDSAAILAPLALPESLEYEANPRGLLRPRRAVCDYYRDHEAVLPPQHLFLTTSTSEGYSYLFRLLCDPGDEVLIAQPSYPLFEFLATLDDVHLTPYPLLYDYGWQIDFHSLRQRITSRTRAIALVHPNNPTGHFTGPAEREALESLAVQYGLALIIDEVFLDYPITSATGDAANAAKSFAVGPHPALTFVLSGLSKIAALPQMKSAWIACFGPQAELTEALNRLAVIADTFLSVNAPIQNATPAWLAGRDHIQSQILTRVHANLRELDEQLAGQSLVNRLRVDAGWYAVLRVPVFRSGEASATELLRDHGVAIHPGYLFSFSGDEYIVVSLLSPTTSFRIGARLILSYFNNIPTGVQA